MTPVLDFSDEISLTSPSCNALRPCTRCKPRYCCHRGDFPSCEPCSLACPLDLIKSYQAPHRMSYHFNAESSPLEEFWVEKRLLLVWFELHGRWKKRVAEEVGVLSLVSGFWKRISNRDKLETPPSSYIRGRESRVSLHRYILAQVQIRSLVVNLNLFTSQTPNTAQTASSLPRRCSASVLRPRRNSNSHRLASHSHQHSHRPNRPPSPSPDRNQSHTPPSAHHTAPRPSHAGQMALTSPSPNCSTSPAACLLQRLVQRSSRAWVRRRNHSTSLPMFV